MKGHIQRMTTRKKRRKKKRKKKRQLILVPTLHPVRVSVPCALAAFAVAVALDWSQTCTVDHVART
jgi:hypothetical protein